MFAETPFRQGKITKLNDSLRVDLLRQRIFPSWPLKFDGFLNGAMDEDINLTLFEINFHQSKLNEAKARLKELKKQDRPLEPDEYRRYGRQMLVSDIGLLGQKALKSSSVLIVGIGGLGCPAAAYLAGAGIGTIGLVDGDIVELSNLHRQILHLPETIGQKKVHSAMRALKRYASRLELSQSRNEFASNGPDPTI